MENDSSLPCPTGDAQKAISISCDTDVESSLEINENDSDMALDACGSTGDHARENLPQTLRSNLWKPGQSGNPSGRRKIDPIVKELLIGNAPAAAQALVDLVKDPKTPPKIRCDAAAIILERVYGKAVQPIDANINGSGDPLKVEFVGILEKWCG